MVQAQMNRWRSEIWKAGKPRSPRTIRSIFLRLRAGCQFAVRMGTLDRNPCDGVTAPSVPKPSFQVWSPSEAKAFLAGVAAFHAHYAETRPGQWLMPAVAWDLLLREGMRRGEMLGLRWQDVDLNRGTAHIVQSVIPVTNRH